MAGKKRKTGGKVIRLTLPDAEWAALDDLATRRGTTWQALVHEAAAEFVRKAG